MKDTISLSVSRPCSEKWDQFAKTAIGGYCQLCQKEVIDFSRMSDSEIKRFFKTPPAKVCGRFNPNQLKSYHVYDEPPARHNWLFPGLMSLVLLAMHKPAMAQPKVTADFSDERQLFPPVDVSDTSYLEHRVTGVVIDEDAEPIAGATVTLLGSTIGVNTDINGKFEFPTLLKPGDVLIFSFIGMKSKEYQVPKNQTEVLNISLSLKMYGEILGEVAIEGPYRYKNTFFDRFWSGIKRVL